MLWTDETARAWSARGFGKGLEKKLKVLERFCKLREKGGKAHIFTGKVFAHGSLLCATDGKIFAWTDGGLEGVPFSWFEAGKGFEWKGPENREVKETAGALRGGEKLEGITVKYDYKGGFVLDFNGIEPPSYLMPSWERRWEVPLELDVKERGEAQFEFDGGAMADGGVSAAYDNTVVRVWGEVPPVLRLKAWFVLEIMKRTKERRLSFRLAAEGSQWVCECSAGPWKFIFYDAAF